MREAFEPDNDWFQEGRLVLPPDLPIEAWLLIGGHLRRIHRNVGFWLGDHELYGERTYGERAAQDQDPANTYEAQTKANAKWVAREFPPSRRREPVPVQANPDVLVDLPYFAYEAVAGLADEKDQDEVLDRFQERQAEGNPMTRDELRARVKTRKAAAEPEQVERSCFTAACRRCDELGPVVCCIPDHPHVEKRWMGQWLSDHRGHDLILLDEQQAAEWEETRAQRSAGVTFQVVK